MPNHAKYVVEHIYAGDMTKKEAVSKLILTQPFFEEAHKAPTFTSQGFVMCESFCNFAQSKNNLMAKIRFKYYSQKEGSLFLHISVKK